MARAHRHEHHFLHDVSTGESDATPFILLLAVIGVLIVAAAIIMVLSFVAASMA